MNRKGTLKEFLTTPKYYNDYRGLFYSDMAAALINAAATLAIPLLVRFITGTVILLPKAEAMPLLLKYGIIMAALCVLVFGCQLYMTYYGHMMGTYQERDMRSELFAHFQKLSFSFYDNARVGSLMSRVTSDLFDITELLHHGPENILICTVKIIGAYTILALINWRLALISLCIVAVMFAVTYYYNEKLLAAFSARREVMSQMSGHLEDELNGIRVVKSFANEDHEIAAFERINALYVESKKKAYEYMAKFYSGVEFFSNLITVISVLAGAVFIARGTMSVPDLLAFVLYTATFVDSVKRILDFTEVFQSGLTGYLRFREILAVEPEIRDKANAVRLGAAPAQGNAAAPGTETAAETIKVPAAGSAIAAVPGSVRGEITFEHVWFHYGMNKELVLKDINLTIPAGQYAALCGSSGAGKTTLCSLIPRFYEATEGAVRIDGADVRDVTLRSLREQIGIVQQDVYLFAGNVIENIRYGRPGASDAECIEAARRANAHDFIIALPDGYQTDIGQRGVKLSGGQKQRISIARVFLKNPPVLIFDEATSALDNESERIIRDSLEQLAKGRTTLVIAHRLSTIRNAERILVMDGDGIAEEGTHEELLARGGVYADLYKQGY